MDGYKRNEGGCYCTRITAYIQAYRKKIVVVKNTAVTL